MKGIMKEFLVASSVATESFKSRIFFAMLARPSENAMLPSFW